MKFPPPPGARHVWRLAAITAVTGLAYANSFSVPFQYDDLSNIVVKAALHVEDLSALTGLIQTLSLKRILPNWTFAFNWYLGQGNTVGYHVVNLLIHLAVAWAGYGLCYLMLRRTSYARRAAPIAGVAALLWAVHPVNSQAVTYIVQRLASLCALGYLTCLYCYLAGHDARGWRRAALWLAAAAAAVVAMLSKEIAGTLPLALFLTDLFFVIGLEGSRVRRRLVWYGAVGLLLAFVVWLYFPGWEHWTRSLRGPERSAYGMGEKLLTEARVTLHYLSLLVLPLPSRLRLLYDILPSPSLVSPVTTLLAVGLILAAGAGAAALALVRRVPIVSFCILWFLLHLIIEAAVPGLDLVYEHRLYLPSVGLLLLLALGLEHGLGPTTRGLGVGLLAASFVFGTLTRNAVWQDHTRLWADTVKKAPANPQGHLNLGYYYEQAGRFDEAEARYREAIRLQANYATAHNNLGGLLSKQGQLKEARIHFDQALIFQPGYISVHINMGNLEVLEGHHEAALARYQEALTINPRHAIVQRNTAMLLDRMGHTDEAIGHYEASLEVHTNQLKLHERLVTLYEQRGEVDQAAKHHWAAMGPPVTLPERRFAVGNLFLRHGRQDEAIRQFREAIRLRPDWADAYHDLGEAYEAKGERTQAEAAYRRAIQLSPMSPHTHLRLGLFYQAGGDRGQALRYLQESLRLAPDQPDAVQLRQRIAQLRAML